MPHTATLEQTLGFDLQGICGWRGTSEWRGHLKGKPEDSRGKRPHITVNVILLSQECYILLQEGDPEEVTYLPIKDSF